MRVTAAVDRLRRAGVEVFDFGAGEPDFGTPPAIGAAAHAVYGGARAMPEFAAKDYSALLEWACRNAGIETPRTA